MAFHRRDDRGSDNSRPRFGRQNQQGRPSFGRDQNRRPFPPRQAQSDETPDNIPAAPPELETDRPKPPPVHLPEGTPVVHLRSASYSAFIYQRMIGDIEGSPSDGDFVAVIDKWGKFFGWGFYNSRSMIALRMFSHTPDVPDDTTIARRVARAVSLRRDTLGLDKTTDAYRLVHAEGDGLSGLIADRFGEYIVLELFSLAMYKRIEKIQDAFIDAGLNVRNFIVRADKHIGEQEGFKISSLPDQIKDREVVITENGVKFNVLLSKGHKTGFFCDQRENRMELTRYTPGKSVLDVCCYSGGFSCYAATLGKASSVTAVDLDENALVTAKQNADLNNARIDFKHVDAFDYLRNTQQSGHKWDVVILDPSKFVARRDMIDVGLRKYADLNRLAAGVVAPGGMVLTCSCSGLVDQPTFVQTVGRAMRAGGRTMQIIRVNGAGPDHPFHADTPEAVYLKAVWARLD